MQCYNCHTQIAREGTPTRNDTCPSCAAYLHCCLNCHFYAPAAHNQCREPQAEWIKDKEMANFCDYFRPVSERKQETSRKEDAMKKLNELFKKK